MLFSCALVLVMMSQTRPAAAHASDFETLTIDLLLTSDGLRVIDAALNSAPGPSYEPFPSDDERRSVAVDVLGSLGIDLAKADINAAMSDRYHEVGFTVRLREAYTNAGSGELRIETAQLQRIASERKVKHLKVSLCDTNGDSFTASGSRVLSPFVIQANGTPPGREPDPAGARAERFGCVVWDLEPTGAPVSIRARVVSRTLAATGSDLSAIGAATLFIGTGVVLLVAKEHAQRAYLLPK